ncbi:kinectin-like, partial [Ictidomys tridecemlineatus]|uniref:kinectin-like n=1 Tax=Ictidomys tridecemlineatus TaxID=43179 RepID=UPI000B54865D
AAAAHELEKIQKSVHIKDDKIRLLEEQLQCEISNKIEEFKILNDQNKALQLEVQKLQTLLSEQVRFFMNYKVELFKQNIIRSDSS